VAAGTGDRRRHLEGGEQGSAVAVDQVDEERRRRIVDGGSLGGQASVQQLVQGVGVERLEAKEGRAAEQGAVHLEERVLGGGAHQG